MITIARPDKTPPIELDPPTILLAEDDGELRSILANMLRRRGYRVLEAVTGAHLLWLIQSCFYSGQGVRVPELILSDVRMPGLSGLEVLRWVRGSDRLTPVILLTAFGDPALHRRAQELGAACVLDKPFDLALLRSRVEELVPIN